MTREDLVERSGEEELLFLDPKELDEAIVGVTLDQVTRRSVVVYDYEKLVEIHSRDMPREDAEEHLEFNTLGAWCGERTPIFIRTFE